MVTLEKDGPTFKGKKVPKGFDQHLYYNRNGHLVMGSSSRNSSYWKNKLNGAEHYEFPIREASFYTQGDVLQPSSKLAAYRDELAQEPLPPPTAVEKRLMAERVLEAKIGVAKAWAAGLIIRGEMPIEGWNKVYMDTQKKSKILSEARTALEDNNPPFTLHYLRGPPSPSSPLPSSTRAIHGSLLSTDMGTMVNRAVGAVR